MPAAYLYVAQQLEAHIDFTPEGHWLWTGRVAKNGYGQVRIRGILKYAHRAVWELLRGPIPEDKHLDHVKARGCEIRHCCNPEHLEPVTQQENNRRAAHRKTHCPRGHDYSVYGVLTSNSKGGVKQRCRLCRYHHWKG
jgi:hypothetical protein